MSHAIQLLEQLGRNPASAQPWGGALAAAVDGLDASPLQRAALHAGDLSALASGHATRTLFCMLTTPDQDAPARSPDDAPQDDEPRRDPDRDPYRDDDRGAERGGH